jgi:hypothetical protein
VKKQNWLQMRETAAAGPLFKAVSRASSTILFRASSGAAFLMLYQLLQLQLDILYIKPIKS